MVFECNQTILTLQTALKTAQQKARKRETEYNAEVACLQRDKSDLQFALDALKREVTKFKESLSISIGDFKQWMRKNSVSADTLISDLDPLTCSNDIHHVLAHNALLKVHSQDWSSAYELAKKVGFNPLIHVPYHSSTRQVCRRSPISHGLYRQSSRTDKKG